MNDNFINSEISSDLAKIFSSNWEKHFITDVKKNTKLTYGQFYQVAENIEAILINEKILTGDVVCSIQENSVVTLAFYLASIFLGNVALPIDPKKGNDELAEIFAYGKPKITILSENSKWLPPGKTVTLQENIFPQEHPSCNAEKIKQKFSAKNYSGLCLLTFTSGSSGKPKGVLNSFRNLYLSSKAFGKKFGFGSKNIFLHNLPMSYVAGILNLFWLPLLSNSKIAVIERFSISQTASFWENVSKAEANTFWLIPSEVAFLLRFDRGSKGIEYASKNQLLACVGTAPLSAVNKRAFEIKYGFKIYESYGLSETLFVSTNYPDIGANEDCVGELLDGVEVKLRDDGELLIRTNWMYLGYSNVASDMVMDHDFFISGDLGEFDNAGLLHIIGRKKDIIIRGGINISPKKLEDYLAKKEIFIECTVIGIPDLDMGERVVCFYVPALNYTVDERKIIAHKILSDLGIDYKIDEFIELTQIPKNLNGKIDKLVLKENYTKSKKV